MCMYDCFIARFRSQPDEAAFWWCTKYQNLNPIGIDVVDDSFCYICILDYDFFAIYLQQKKIKP